MKKITMPAVAARLSLALIEGDKSTIARILGEHRAVFGSDPYMWDREWQDALKGLGCTCRLSDGVQTEGYEEYDFVLLGVPLPGIWLSTDPHYGESVNFARVWA